MIRLRQEGGQVAVTLIRAEVEHLGDRGGGRELARQRVVERAQRKVLAL